MLCFLIIIKAMKIIIIALLAITINSQLTETYKYSTMNGIQVYYIKNNEYYLYATYSGDSSTLQATVTLMTSKTQAQLDSTNGIYVGLGFGTDGMYNTDMVICQYMPGNKFSCTDYWSVAERSPSTDVMLGGKNDVTLLDSSITSLDSTYSPYITRVTFSFKKDLTNLDQYDWSGFKTWNTSNTKISGAIGNNAADGSILQHIINSDNNKLTDGNNVPNGSLYNTLSIVILIAISMILF